MPRSLLRYARILVTDPVGFLTRIRILARMSAARRRNAGSHERVTGDAPVVVNLTTYGSRIQTVFYPLETIGAGRIRPMRLILWLDDQDLIDHLPPEIERLVARGLEVLPTENWGPHKKQYSYSVAEPDADLPLVAADDDALYDSDWLEGLLAAHRRDPDAIVAYRAHQIVLENGEIAPYDHWQTRTTAATSYAAVAVGVAGILFPVSYQAAMREDGERFVSEAPSSNDLWIHLLGLRHGIRIGQVRPLVRHFDTIPGTQTATLTQRNVGRGVYDEVIATVYGDEERSLITADIERGR